MVAMGTAAGTTITGTGSDLQGLPDLLARQDRLGPPDPWDQLDLQDRQDPREPWDQLDRQDPPAP